MNIRIGIIAICILAFAFVGGCKKHSEIVKEEGMNEEYMLSKFPRLSHVYRENQEIFFHVEQLLNQGWFGQNQIKLIWSKEGKINMATVRLGNIHFVEDEAKEIPTVKFTVFSNQHMSPK